MSKEDIQAVYLHGFASGPSSRKARFFQERFVELGIQVTVPDLAQGDFKGLTISGQLAVVESCLEKDRPAVLIGSSLGGYLAALYAARHPEVRCLILLAPAFDFAELWNAGMSPEQASRWQQEGVLNVYHYGMGRDMQLGYQFLEDARRFEGFPNANQPILILHGTEDRVVPIQFSQRFAREHPQAKLIPLLSGHELTDVLDPIWEETQMFLEDGGSLLKC